MNLHKRLGVRDFNKKSQNRIAGKTRSRDAVFQRDDAKYNSVRADKKQITIFHRHAKSIGFGIGFLSGWLLSLVIAIIFTSFAVQLLVQANNSLHLSFLSSLFESMRHHNSIAGGAFAYYVFKPIFVLIGCFGGMILMVGMGRQATKAIAMLDDTALQTDVNDAWIWSVEEMIEQYAVIADLGMHSKTVSVSSIVGHIYLKNSGLKTINLAQHTKTGQIVRDENGEIVRKKVSMINDKPLRKILDMQGLRELSEKEVPIDARKYNYDEKDGRVRTLADAINEDWFMPDYEILRPMGAYFIETNSVHTLVLSMTRGNKTQLASMSTVDVWRRDSTRWNLLVNDPKGEMQMASYQLLQKANYDVVPFSLTHPDKAVRYNPLQMVIDYVRRNKIPEASTELSNLSSTFFPSTGGDDFWISTARSVFQMMTYQLMNYMVDEERRAIRIYQSKQFGNVLTDQFGSLGNMVRPEINSQSSLDKYIDDLWGDVSMNSMYQMIAQLDAIKMPDSLVAASDIKYSWKDGEEVETPEEVSGLDVMSSAIRELPDNAIRRNFKGPDTMLRKASGSDATTGSIYATALNNMSFFVQETIKKLTTVSPKNGLNILDFPFPRRFSVRLNSLVVQKMNLGRRRFKATLYKDPFFTIPYGDKKHDTVDDGAVASSGWIDFWFQKIPKPRSGQFYIKIEILDSTEETVIVELYFAVDKGYLLSEDGDHYVLDPITNNVIVKDGTAFEVKPMTKAEAIELKRLNKTVKMTQRKNGHVYTKRLRDYSQNTVDMPVISQIMFNYTEKPKALFLSIPPQIEEQSKLGLVLIDSVFNTSMGKGYEVRGDTQKPDYGTRYMLEELGNLKADGQGIQSFDSKLSIGLSANQQMTMIFQNMEQITSIYGESMIATVAANVGTIHYMLSTNPDTLEYISGLTGKTHRIEVSGQNLTTVIGSVDKNGVSPDNTIGLSKGKTEVPVITTNELSRLTDGETVVITPTRRRDKMNRVTRTNPILNTDRQSLPFAYALLSPQTKATEASGQGTAETASTIYSTVDSQPDQMVPDFKQVLRVTMRQAMYYVRHKDQILDKFVTHTTPLGSEALSEAIMDYLNYELDINAELIKDGLAPYMMLTKSEIVTAYRNVNTNYSISSDLAEQLLAKLGYDISVLEKTSLPEDHDVRIEEAMATYMGEDVVGVSSDEFDVIFNRIVSNANSGDEMSVSLLDEILDMDNWNTPIENLNFIDEDDISRIIDDDSVEVLSGGSGAYMYKPSSIFKRLFKGNDGDEVFSNHEMYEMLCEVFFDNR